MEDLLDVQWENSWQIGDTVHVYDVISFVVLNDVEVFPECLPSSHQLVQDAAEGPQIDFVCKLSSCIIVREELGRAIAIRTPAVTSRQGAPRRSRRGDPEIYNLP